MQGVDQYAGIASPATLHQRAGRFEIRHCCPRHKLDVDRHAVPACEFAERGEIVAQAAGIPVVAGGQHVTSSELRRDLKKRNQGPYVEGSRHPNQFDVANAQVRFAKGGKERLPCCAVPTHDGKAVVRTRREQADADFMKSRACRRAQDADGIVFSVGQVAQRYAIWHGSFPFRDGQKPHARRGRSGNEASK